MCCSILQCLNVIRMITLQCVAVRCSTLQCVTLCCIMLQYVVVFCNVGVLSELQYALSRNCHMSFAKKHICFEDFPFAFPAIFPAQMPLVFCKKCYFFWKLMIHSRLLNLYLILLEQIWDWFYLIILDLPLTYMCPSIYVYGYGVATISRLLKMIGLFCKRAL